MLITKGYRRDRALEYAERWAFERNPLFFNFTGFGGDCTSFVSQCIFAGSCEMNFTPVFGWYYIDSENRTASWTGVEFLYNFITSNAGIGPYAREAGADELEAGDVVQLANESGDYYHTLLVSGREGGEILVAAHSDDAFNRPLSSYNFATARYIHIEGVRFEIDFSSDSCFLPLLRGEQILP